MLLFKKPIVTIALYYSCQTEISIFLSLYSMPIWLTHKPQNANHIQFFGSLWAAISLLLNLLLQVTRFVGPLLNIEIVLLCSSFSWSMQKQKMQNMKNEARPINIDRYHKYDFWPLAALSCFITNRSLPESNILLMSLTFIRFILANFRVLQ